jgi:hypothetical protein
MISSLELMRIELDMPLRPGALYGCSLSMALHIWLCVMGWELKSGCGYWKFGGMLGLVGGRKKKTSCRNLLFSLFDCMSAWSLLKSMVLRAGMCEALPSVGACDKAVSCPNVRGLKVGDPFFPVASFGVFDQLGDVCGRAHGLGGHGGWRFCRLAWQLCAWPCVKQ